MDGAGQMSPARQVDANASLPAKSRFFKPNQGLRRAGF